MNRQMLHTPRILAVEDDSSIVALLKEQVHDLGFELDIADDGMTGLNKALEAEYALVILDLGLPKLGGLEICRQLREAKPAQAIMILTGERGETKTVLGLELGADDYLEKPIRPMELRARMRALLRRANVHDTLSEAQASTTMDSSTLAPAEETSEILVLAELAFDFSLRELRLNGQVIELTPIEFDILELLVQNPRRVFSGDMILDAIWGHTNYSQQQNVRSHISHIRKKLEQAGATRSYIVTKRGHGYRFSVED